MKLLPLVLFFISAFVYAADAFHAKSANFLDGSNAKVRILHEYVGEPISQPERVSVFVTCAKKKEVRAGIYRMCIFDGHEFEAGTHELTVKMFYGRVDPKSGDTTCDQMDMKKIDLEKFCKSATRSSPKSKN